MLDRLATQGQCLLRPAEPLLPAGAAVERARRAPAAAGLRDGLFAGQFNRAAAAWG